MSYSKLPRTPKIPIEPFTLNHPQSELDDLKTLVKLTRIPKKTFENVSPPSSKFGISHDWISEAKDAWAEFDWRKWENRINALPQFKAKVDLGQGEKGGEFDVHFMGLFSKKEDAKPIVFLHGWPGCFLEFMPMFEMVKQKWSAEEMP